jgi:hypothetical protein
MADNYLQFSETLGPLTRKQEAWLQQQLEPIIVINGKEFPENDAPDCDKPDYRGLRFLRDYEDLNDDADTCGFGLEFESTGKRRQAWIYADECGHPGRVAHLVQKFLKQFHPDQCWSLTCAMTCSKLRAGEFGGGAAFVTADDIRWENTYDFIEQQQAKFKARRNRATCITLDKFTPLLEKAKQESPLGGGTCIYLCLLETEPIPVSGAVLERSDDGAIFLILTDEQEEHDNGKTTTPDP